MYINDQYKFIFVHVPKTGGSAVHVAFKDFFNVIDRSDPPPDKHHASLEKIISDNSHMDDICEYFSFAFVRNPWARLLSGFCDFQQIRQKITDIDFKSFVRNIHSGSGHYSNLIEDIHFKPQHLFVESVDYIGRTENLEGCFEEVTSRLGIPKLPLNTAKPGSFIENIHRSTIHKPYREMYDNYTRDVVADMYKEDIKRFDYKYE
jgi:hypothetical protein